MRESLLRRVLLLSVMLTSCGPLGPLPAGRLEGKLASTPAGDWSFSDAYDTVELETRPDDPYSVTLWCVAVGGNLYVGAGWGESSPWARALLDDARARVRFGATLYDVAAVRVTDSAEIENYLDAFSQKYPISDASLSDFQPSPGRSAAALLFRLTSRAGRGATQHPSELFEQETRLIHVDPDPDPQEGALPKASALLRDS